MKLHLRPTVFVGVILATSTVASWAQETARPAPAPSPTRSQTVDEENVVKLDAFIVTGSNIRRIDEERVMPITVYDVDDLALRGASTPVELFEFLPSAGELPISEEGTLGASARGDVASISIRSVGSSNTLTLVNGRRMAPHPISQAEGGVPSLAVNINSLPGAAIQRIEILRDGASAIYGADAAAGVVNALLDRDADGTRLQLRGAITEAGGAGERRATLSDGRYFNAGRSKIRLTVDYFHRDLLMASDRHFAADADMRPLMVAPWDGVPVVTASGSLRDNDLDNSSSTSNFGHFIRGSFQIVDGETKFIGSRPDGNRGITTSTTPGLTLTTRSNTTTVGEPGEFFMVPLADGGTGFRQSTPSRSIESVESNWYYNLNQDRHLLPATDRYNFVGVIDHEFSDRLSAFGEVMYYHADSKVYRDPAGLDATDDPDIFVPASNYWNPFGTRFYHPNGDPNPDGSLRVRGTPADILFAFGTGVRPREFRRKEAEVQSRSGRLVGGLRGKLGRDWEWESAALYGWARTSDLEHWNIRESRLREALARSDETAFNPFGYTFRTVSQASGTNPVLVQISQPYTNPDSVVNPLYDDFLRTAKTSIATWDAKANGPLCELWGRTLRAAVGTELRYETYADSRPPFHGMNPAGSSVGNPYLRENDNDFIGLSPNIDLDASREVIAGFTEVLVPIFAPRHRVPLIRGLEFTAAARYERFSDFGDTLKPKYGVNWRVNNSVGFRASYNESFRAPNLVQTNTTPLQRSVTGVSDPYRYVVTNSLFDGSRTRTVFRQGNDSLQPEEAENFTYGVVVEVPWVQGLSFTADYWRLKQASVISALSASEQLRRDRDALDAFTAAAIAAGQNPDTIDSRSGTADYVGNQKVRRAPVTQTDRDAFAAYNAANPGSRRVAVGAVISVIDDYLNLASRDLDGVDLAVQYRIPRSRLGTFTLRAEATWMSKFIEQVDENAIVEDNLNENGITRWKGNASVTWRIGKWTSGWFTQYVKGTVDTSAALGAGGDNPTDPALLDEVVAALGYPKYFHPFSDTTGAIRLGYLVDDWIVHNAYVQHRFGRQKDIHNNVTLRFGVNNVFDTDPSIADESRGYRTGGSNPRGRQFYLQITKIF
ncbi:MAG: TonB-dependent receptor [Candidatus Didemnitutus sp.]|nr:TonB-dependent receptor [Candidatus Didemnitutus sp.]